MRLKLEEGMVIGVCAQKHPALAKPLVMPEQWTRIPEVNASMKVILFIREYKHFISELVK